MVTRQKQDGNEMEITILLPNIFLKIFLKPFYGFMMVTQQKRDRNEMVTRWIQDGNEIETRQKQDGNKMETRW